MFLFPSLTFKASLSFFSLSQSFYLSLAPSGLFGWTVRIEKNVSVGCGKKSLGSWEGVMAGCLSGPRGWRSTAWQGEGRLEVRKDTKPLQRCQKHPGQPVPFLPRLAIIEGVTPLIKRIWMSRSGGGSAVGSSTGAEIFALRHIYDSQNNLVTGAFVRLRAPRAPYAPLVWHFDNSHVAQKRLFDGELQPYTSGSLSLDLIIPVSGRTLHLLLLLLHHPLHTHTHTLPPIASILALNSPWYSTAPVCSDTEGGRRAVTAQSLVALWLGAAECAMVH